MCSENSFSSSERKTFPKSILEQKFETADSFLSMD
jgi:hypothetical protein